MACGAQRLRARHRARRRPAHGTGSVPCHRLLPLLAPSPSVTAPLSSSPSSPRSPSSASTGLLLPHLCFPSTSDDCLDHRRRLPPLFLPLRLHRLHPDLPCISLPLVTVPAAFVARFISFVSVEHRPPLATVNSTASPSISFVSALVLPLRSPRPRATVAPAPTSRHRHLLHCVAEHHRRSLVLHLSHLLRRPPHPFFLCSTVAPQPSATATAISSTVLPNATTAPLFSTSATFSVDLRAPSFSAPPSPPSPPPPPPPSSISLPSPSPPPFPLPLRFLHSPHLATVSLLHGRRRCGRSPAP